MRINETTFSDKAYKNNFVSSDNYKKRLTQIATLHSLLQVGLKDYELNIPEIAELPSMLQPNEYIAGALVGRNKEGKFMIVATNLRIIYIDTKPLFKKIEDISYEVVSGITLEWVIMAGTFILHTRMGDFPIKTTNHKAARNFKNFVDSRCIERVNGNNYEQYAIQQ